MRRGIYHSFVHTLVVAKRERVNFLYDTKKKRERERGLAQEQSAEMRQIKGSFCHTLALQKQEIAFKDICIARSAYFDAHTCARQKQILRDDVMLFIVDFRT